MKSLKSFFIQSYASTCLQIFYLGTLFDHYGAMFDMLSGFFIIPLRTFFQDELSGFFPGTCRGKTMEMFGSISIVTV